MIIEERANKIDDLNDRCKATDLSVIVPLSCLVPPIKKSNEPLSFYEIWAIMSYFLKELKLGMEINVGAIIIPCCLMVDPS